MSLEEGNQDTTSASTIDDGGGAAADDADAQPSSTAKILIRNNNNNNNDLNTAAAAVPLPLSSDAKPLAHLGMDATTKQQSSRHRIGGQTPSSSSCAAATATSNSDEDFEMVEQEQAGVEGQQRRGDKEDWKGKHENECQTTTTTTTTTKQQSLSGAPLSATSPGRLAARPERRRPSSSRKQGVPKKEAPLPLAEPLLSLETTSPPQQQQQQQRTAPDSLVGSTIRADARTCDENAIIAGNWSLDDDDETTNSSSQNEEEVVARPKRSDILSLADREIFQRLDEEYEQALEEREVAYMARYNSVQQSAYFSVVFMLIFLTLGTIFFIRQAAGEWDISDALLFSVYTITTVGYGSLIMPNTPTFQLYTIFFIFIGIATLTIMVAQVYQYVALAASQAQHGRDQSDLARRGMDALIITRRSRAAGAAATNSSAEDQVMGEIHLPVPWVDRLFQCFERMKVFFTTNEYGRGLSVLFPFAGLIAVGAGIIGPLEGWTAVESVYFAVVSLTTVGFGDYFPTRKASVLFCVLWLPFSVGFMSLFLTNVASFYIRLSDKNIERIEKQLRKRLERAKEQAKRERDAARERALRGQAQSPDRTDEGETKESSTVRSTGSVDSDIEGAAKKPARRGRRGEGFNTLPTAEDEDKDAARSGHNLFGSPKSRCKLVSHREQILQNNLKLPGRQEDGNESEDSIDGVGPSESHMATMGDVLRTIHSNISSSGQGSLSNSFRAGPESEFLSVRSNRALYTHSLLKTTVRKPTFALRALVQERLAEIIATEIAGYQSNVEIKDNSLTVTIESLKQTADKWLIPRRARRAFRSVAFESLYFVGEHGLITRGAAALYDLSPFEFHRLFSSFLAAMGDAETMESWLAGTEVLAEVDLKRDQKDPNSAKTPPGNLGRLRRGQAQQPETVSLGALSEHDQSQDHDIV